eukprot:365263-Chlamydomonas_euryale.AAC.20
MVVPTGLQACVAALMEFRLPATRVSATAPIQPALGSCMTDTRPAASTGGAGVCIRGRAVPLSPRTI